MIKLSQLINESEEKRPLSLEVKKHFLEIVSTYNKYQESMDRKSDITQVAETLGGITEAARTLAIHEGDDWFDKHTIKRNMSELDKLGKQFDKVASEAKALDQRMGGLYEDMGHILSRYYKIGEISEEQMKERLGMNESKEDCGCGCNGTTEGGCNESVNEVSDSEIKKIIKKKERGGPYTIIARNGNRIVANSPKSYEKVEDAIKMYHKLNKKHGRRNSISIEDGYGRTVFMESLNKEQDVINEEPVSVSMRNDDGSITTTIKEVTDLNEQETALYEFGQKVETLMEKNCPTNPSKWSSYKSQAKQKFDVYPSAYANGWAAKKYKAAGGGWKKC